MREVMDLYRCAAGSDREGELDEAPMLYIARKVGGGIRCRQEMGRVLSEVDIAVDPLEGTNLCAHGANNAIRGAGGCQTRRLAARAGYLHGQDRRRPSSRGVIDIDAPVKDNLRNIARRLVVTSKTDRDRFGSAATQKDNR